MIDHFWPAREKHPPLSAILMHLEGDLDGRESAKVTQHLKDCWECRAACKKITRGIDAFMEYRRVVLLPSVQVPPSRNRLQRRSREVLSALPTASRLASLVSIATHALTGSRIAVCIGAAISAAVLLAVLTMPIARPPRLSAAQLIQRTRESSISEVPRQSNNGRKEVALQKIELRLGDRVIQREIVLAGGRAAVAATPPDAAWAHLLDGTPVDWRNPLGADRYEHWREMEGKGVDLVSEADGLATLTTVPASRALITRASLTVRESDWHAVAKRVEFADRPALVIRELEFRMHELPQPSKAASAAKPSPAPDRTTAEISSLAPIVPPSLPAIGEIGPDQAEVEVREALHRLGADVEEFPEITRGGSTIHVEAVVQTEQRKDELLAALREIPSVTTEIFDPETVSTPLPAQPSAASTYPTEPPLIAALRDQFGGLDAANAYLHGVRDSYRQTLVHASALQRLGERYGGPEWDRMPPELRARVNQLASDYITAVQKNSESYLTQVSTGLDDMLSFRQLTTQTTAVADAGCEPWQTAAEPVASVLREIEASFQRLFVVEMLDKPVAFSADGLLVNASRLRDQLSQMIGRLCVPDPIH